MPRPTRIRVLGKRWHIEYVDDLKNDAGNDVYGTCDEGSLTIKIKTWMPVDLQKHTILHELTHAIEYGMGLKLKERETDLISGGYMALLHDNPEFADFLVGL
jgi:hypothetical protein